VNLRQNVIDYSTTMSQEELAAWLMARCEELNLSWAEASRRAGVSPNAISEIVNGTPAGVKRLSALADFFGVSREYVFRLAGHLRNRATTDAQRAELRRKVEHIAELLADLPPDLQDRLADAIIVQAEASKAVFEAAERYVVEEQQSKE
jgi:transcriptional regulator with XRE-family HTH domain